MEVGAPSAGETTEKVMIYRLADARTGLTLLAIPVETYPSERQALAVAGRQARRHASAGTWVLLTGEGTALLYVGDRYYVLCEECRRWMAPRRRGNVCATCRSAAEHTPAASKPAAIGTPPRKRSRRRRISSEQLELPDLLEFTE